MSPEEAADFERNPNFSGILQVRRWDEAAKLTDAQTPDVAYYLEKCRAHLAG